MSGEAMQSKFARFCSRGTILFREGDPGNTMYIIQSGKVEISRTIGAQEAVLAVLPAGEFFGEMSIINNRPRSATAIVLEDAQLLCIDAKTLETMIRANSEIAVRMIKRLADRLEQANRQIEVLLYREPNHRLVRFLRREAETSGFPSAVGFRVSLTDAELAQRVGLTLEEVRQAIERLERARLLTRSPAGGFVISEVGRLQEFLEFLDIKERFGL